MWLLGGFIALCYVAWCSGEHHAERAKRIVENNRIERRKKWREIEKNVRTLKNENKNLRELLKGLRK